MGEPKFTTRMDTLPNELLVKIFKLARTEVPDSIHMQTDCAKWTPILLVCKRWNEIATSTPELWRAITVSSRADMHTMGRRVERARHLTLDVFLDNFGYDIDAVVQMLLPHAPRIRRLHIDYIPQPRFAKIDPLLRQKFPALELLSLSLQRRGSMVPWEWTPTMADVDFPRLETLHLEDLSIPERLPGSARLRRLTLKGIQWNEDPFTYDTLLDTLSACPLLEYLELDRVFPTISPDQEAPRSISLPNLHTLVLRNSLAHIHFAFESLTPLAAKPAVISVTGIRNPYFYADQRLCHQVPEDPAMLPPLRAAKRLKITSLDSEHSLVAHTDVDGESLSIRVEHPDTGSWTGAAHLQRAIQDARQLFAGAPVAELDINGDVGFPSAEWAELFREFPSVRALAVSGVGSTTGLFSALGQVSEHDVPLPGLRTLRFSDALSRLQTIVDLTTCLEGRARAGGARLDEIRVGKCYLSHDHLLPSAGK